ncbi:MAG TPA: hypothetical protein VMC42_08070 [Methanoregulaceae archaeon]|nr:hypothetical protein [Methanoregulaceae archaeon]
MIVFCFILVTAGVLFAGCSSLPGTPAVQTTQPTPVVTAPPTPAISAPATTPSAVSTTPPTTVATVPAVDGAFLSAYSDSRAKILGILTNINTEVVKDGNQNASLPDYTALGSYGRQLGVAIGAETESMQRFRQFEDPANEALRDQYVSYLSALMPFAGNIEAGGGVAQKRQYSVASQYFSNAQNDLGVVRTVPLPEQRTVINQIRTNLGPLHDLLASQAAGSGL